MEQKIFKRREDLKIFIEQQEIPHFYIIKDEVKTFLKKQVIALIYTIDDVKNYLLILLENLLTELDFKDVVINITEVSREGFKVTINCNNNALLIGKNGYVLSSLQNLTNCYLSSKFHRRYNVKIDVNDYFSRQEINLINLVRNIAKKIISSKEDFTLLPMPNNQRRVVHSEIKKFPELSTQSVGNGNQRHIVIKYVKNNFNNKEV